MRIMLFLDFIWKGSRMSLMTRVNRSSDTPYEEVRE